MNTNLNNRFARIVASMLTGSALWYTTAAPIWIM